MSKVSSDQSQTDCGNCQYSEELSFALGISAEVDAIALNYFNRGVDVVTKDDGSPVTRADKEVESMIRKAIAKRFPEDSILGEEEGASCGKKSAGSKREDRVAGKDESSTGNGANYPDNNGAVERKWIIDPIDGTFNFARGIPIWSTLLALEVQSHVVLGVVSAPAMEEKFHAAKGSGAFKNDQPIHVSEVSDLGQALFNFGGPNRIEAAGLWPSLQEAVKLTYRQRGFGDYLGFSLVFEGKAEAMLEVDVKPWDLAPMKIIVEEAGGCFIDLSGGASIYPGSCLVTNRHLMKEFKRIFVK